MVLLGSPLCLVLITILWHQETGSFIGGRSSTPIAMSLLRSAITRSYWCTVINPGLRRTSQVSVGEDTGYMTMMDSVVCTILET